MPSASIISQFLLENASSNNLFLPLNSWNLRSYKPYNLINYANEELIAADL